MKKIIIISIMLTVMNVFASEGEPSGTPVSGTPTAVAQQVQNLPSLPQMAILRARLVARFGQEEADLKIKALLVVASKARENLPTQQ